MTPIKIHKHASDPYWDRIKRGIEMTPEERYDAFFLMLKRNRAMTGRPVLGERKIVIRSTKEWT